MGAEALGFARLRPRGRPAPGFPRINPTRRTFAFGDARLAALRPDVALDLDQCATPIAAANVKWRRGAQVVMRVGLSVLLRVVAAGAVLLVALALNGQSATACGRFPAWLVVQPGVRIAAVRDSNHALVAAELTAASQAEPCATGGPSGDQCGGDHCCGGHGPCCSGGVLAPASTDLLAPRLSSERLTRFARVMAGVSQPPDKRPPRLI